MKCVTIEFYNFGEKTMKIKIISIILTISMIFILVPFIASASENSNVVGDVNENLRVEITDSTCIQQNLARLRTLSDRQKLLGDVDDNNILNIVDATNIQQYLAHIINEFKRKSVDPSESTQATETETMTPINPYITETGLAKELKNGTIFHAWCWSFNTIKDNLTDIAAAGFTSVQTSPISQCKVGEDGGLEIYGKGKWYYHYQPTKFVIGNYQLGTEEEFIALCKEAHKLNMNIIVDAVINHCSSDYAAIDSSVKNISGGAFHDKSIYWSQENRYHETQGQISELWDLKTQNPNVQNMLKNYLVNCVRDGADGFRYDTAKLIELPDDDKSFASDCWNVVLDNGAKFQYGENLQDAEDLSVCRLSDYAKIMNVTSSLYGEKIRTAVNTNNLSASYIKDYMVGDIDPSKLVTWVESHDNYCNESSWSYIDEQESIRAWAIIAARKGGTPLYFNRPMNSTTEDPWGDNKLQVPGSDLYKDKQVVAVNFFRNEMGTLDETLSNPSSNTKVLMIERENKGAVIINSDSKDFTLSSINTKLSDGIYTDKVSGSSFSVSNGRLTGTVKKGRVAVIYNSSAKPLSFKSNLSLSVTTSNFYSDSLDVTLTAKSCTDMQYKIDNGIYQSFKDGDFVTVGASLADKETVTVTIKAKGTEGTIEKSATYTKQKDANTIAYFDKAAFPTWTNVYLYAYNGNGAENAKWPGIKMTDIGNQKYKYILPEKLAGSTNIIFNNGSGGTGYQYPETDGLQISIHQKKMLNYRKEWEDYPLKTIYFKNTLGWGSVYCYFWGGETTTWPGVISPKYDSTNKIYCMTLFGEETSVIFSNGSTYQTIDITSFRDGDLFTPDTTYIAKDGQRIYNGKISKYN